MYKYAFGEERSLKELRGLSEKGKCFEHLFLLLVYSPHLVKQEELCHAFHISPSVASFGVQSRRAREQEAPVNAATARKVDLVLPARLALLATLALALSGLVSSLPAIGYLSSSALSAVGWVLFGTSIGISYERIPGDGLGQRSVQII